jgi:hypothetical protein
MRECGTLGFPFMQKITPTFQTQQQRDENLMLVAAIEQYAQKHRIPTADSFAIFKQYGVNTLIRKHYNTLHTQPLEESFYFAEDVINRIQNEKQTHPLSRVEL